MYCVIDWYEIETTAKYKANLSVLYLSTSNVPHRAVLGEAVKQNTDLPATQTSRWHNINLNPVTFLLFTPLNCEDGEEKFRESLLPSKIKP